MSDQPKDTATRRAAQMAEVRDEFDQRMETGVDEYNATHADEPYDQPSAKDQREAAIRKLAEARDADDWEIRSSDETTMAEEPREDAERRQWLNGYMMGFREGFERSRWLS